MDERSIQAGGTEQLMVVKQLPIIEERLQQKAEEIRERTAMACSMACTPETVIEVKKIRAELNKEFAEYETARKNVKKAVMAPYETFEATYKTCISDAYGEADRQLRQMVENVEYHLRDTKERGIRMYYQEHLAAAGLNAEDWAFERTGITVLLSKSDKALKTEARKWIEARASDMASIRAMNHSDEIMVEYKRCMNLSQAVLTVKDRHDAAEAEREAREREEAARIPIPEEKPIVEALEPPVVEVVPEVPPADEKILKLCFTVYGTRTELKALKKFLVDGGYRYE